MLLIEKDQSGNVLVKSDGMVAIITGYNITHRAIMVNFGYCTPNEIAAQIETIFQNAGTILKLLCDNQYAILEKVCYKSNGKKYVATNTMKKIQIEKMMDDI